jgi:hypothetical protein
MHNITHTSRKKKKIIKSSLKFTPCPTVNENYIQAAIINIKLKQVPISIAAMYCPPNYKISPTQYNAFFNFLNPNFILGAT